MGAIAHFLQAGQNLRPGHLRAVIRHRHRVGHQLKSGIKGAVMFAVKVPVRCIGNIQNLFGVGRMFSPVVHLQFDTKIPAVIPIKNGVRLVMVMMDVTEFFVAAVTIRGILFFVQIVGIVITDQAATPIADRIVVEVAVAAQGDMAIALILFLEDSFAAAVTGSRQFFKTIFAIDLIMKGVGFTGPHDAATVNTGIVAHIYYLPYVSYMVSHVFQSNNIYLSFPIIRPCRVAGYFRIQHE